MSLKTTRADGADVASFGWGGSGGHEVQFRPRCFIGVVYPANGKMSYEEHPLTDKQMGLVADQVNNYMAVPMFMGHGTGKIDVAIGHAAAENLDVHPRDIDWVSASVETVGRLVHISKPRNFGDDWVGVFMVDSLEAQKKIDNGFRSLSLTTSIRGKDPDSIFISNLSLCDEPLRKGCEIKAEISYDEFSRQFLSKGV